MQIAAAGLATHPLPRGGTDSVDTRVDCCVRIHLLPRGGTNSMMVRTEMYFEAELEHSSDDVSWSWNSDLVLHQAAVLISPGRDVWGRAFPSVGTGSTGLALK